MGWRWVVTAELPPLPQQVLQVSIDTPTPATIL